MKTGKLLLLAITAVALGLTGLGYQTDAEATANDKVDIQQDCGLGCLEPLDTAGPTGFGFVNYNVADDSGTLRIVVSLKNAAPDTTYPIYLVCGPTHATACGFIEIGSITTNGQGNGNSGAILLADNPYGGGSDDHIDIGISGATGVYVATPIVH